MEREPVQGAVPDLGERAHDEVRGVGGQRPGALALDLHLERPGPALDLDHVAQRQRDPEAVVAGPRFAEDAGALTVMRSTRRSMVAFEALPR